MKQANDWVDHLQLQAHPEGGYYKEMYRSTGIISHHALPACFDSERNFSTSIYFLLTQNEFSAFHRIHQDEIWHFYDGVALNIHVIDKSGCYTCIKLGRDVVHGEVLQAVVEAGNWFAASVAEQAMPSLPSSYSLVGCTVAPGFDFADFELADRANLSAQFPQHQKLIHVLTRAS